MFRISRRHLLGGGAAAAGLLSTANLQRALAQSGPVKLGAFLSVSGPGAYIGQQIQLGLEIGTHLVNQAGGINGQKLELVVADTKTSPAGAVAAVRELLGQGIRILAGGAPTFEVAAAIPLIKEAGAFYLTAGASGMAVTHEMWDKQLFRTTDNDYAQSAALAELSVQRYPDITDWVCLSYDTASGKEGMELFQRIQEKAYARIGKKVNFVETQFMKLDATDMRPQIAAVMNSKAQGIYQILYGQGGVTFYQQARAFGLHNKIKVIYDRGNEFNLAKALKDKVPNTWTMAFWEPGAYKHIPHSEAVAAEYKKRSQDPYSNSFIFTGTFIADTVKAAVGAAKSTEPAALISVLEGGLKVPSVKGPIGYRKEDHQAMGEIMFMLIQPDEGSQAGFKIGDYAKFDGTKLFETPTPGVKFDMGSI
jgi:branched-chain amino acid transport system substrate-binding protein